MHEKYRIIFQKIYVNANPVPFYPPLSPLSLFSLLQRWNDFSFFPSSRRAHSAYILESALTPRLFAFRQFFFPPPRRDIYARTWNSGRIYFSSACVALSLAFPAIFMNKKAVDHVAGGPGLCPPPYNFPVGGERLFCPAPRAAHRPFIRSIRLSFFSLPCTCLHTHTHTHTHTYRRELFYQRRIFLQLHIQAPRWKFIKEQRPCGFSVLCVWVVGLYRARKIAAAKTNLIKWKLNEDCAAQTRALRTPLKSNLMKLRRPRLRLLI